MHSNLQVVCGLHLHSNFGNLQVFIYPNPFNLQISITYVLAQSSDLTIKIIDSEFNIIGDTDTLDLDPRSFSIKPFE